MGTIHQVNRKRAADYVPHPRVYIRDTCPINMEKQEMIDYLFEIMEMLDNIRDELIEKVEEVDS